MTNEMYAIVSAIRSDVYKQLDETKFMYESEIDRLGVTDTTEETVMEYLNQILVDEKLRKRLANVVSKAIVIKNNEKIKAYKIEKAKNTKLWKITKGKIPCLRECGYFLTKTKNELMRDSNNFICSDCSSKHDNSDSMNLFMSKNIWKIFNIS
jgi:hypothetical protein